MNVVLYATTQTMLPFESACAPFLDKGAKVLLRNPKFFRPSELESLADIVVTDRADIASAYENRTRGKTGERIVVVFVDPEADREAEAAPSEQAPKEPGKLEIGDDVHEAELVEPPVAPSPEAPAEPQAAPDPVEEPPPFPEPEPMEADAPHAGKTGKKNRRK